MSEQEEFPPTVEEFVERMESARAALLATLEGLSEEQLSAPITASGWSAIDHVSHLAVWMDGMTTLLRSEPRWAAMGAAGPPASDAGFDELNEQLRAPHRHKRPDEALAWLGEVHERMVAALRGLTMADLQLPYRHYQPDEVRDDADDPVINWVAGDTYGHYEEHMVWISAGLAAQGWR